jgi:hypothetical protein
MRTTALDQSLVTLWNYFRLSMPEGIELAAPQGYWFDNEGVMTPSKECHGTSNFNLQSEFQPFAWREVL